TQPVPRAEKNSKLLVQPCAAASSEALRNQTARLRDGRLGNPLLASSAAHPRRGYPKLLDDGVPRRCVGGVRGRLDCPRSSESVLPGALRAAICGGDFIFLVFGGNLDRPGDARSGPDSCRA